jgi:general secretion pathway protein B
VTAAPSPVTATPPPATRPAPTRSTAAAPAPDATAAPEITLQVLSWSPEPKDRFVFLNGRRYGEGQMVEDRFLLEHITEDGVVLSRQGERIVLRGR